jgi:transglutaminase-like putative cysteine protease
MYEYVLNTIEFQPYTGAMKGPLAVLQTKAGNDWDTDSLLAEMFSAAGIATQFVPGRINAPIQAVEDYVGAFNPNGAEQVLNAAGLSAARLADLGKPCPCRSTTCG